MSVREQVVSTIRERIGELEEQSKSCEGHTLNYKIVRQQELLYIMRMLDDNVEWLAEEGD